MKYKLIGIAAVLLMLAAVVAAELYPETENRRWQQHINAPPKAECAAHNEETLCTHLPLLQITTENGVEIPGRLLGHDAEGRRILSTTEEGADRVMATLAITDNAGQRNHTGDAPQLQSSAIIHVRGHSSRLFDKSGYDIRLVNEDGSNRRESVMGMDAHHEWALHGPILDKTLIRNYMWYNIAGETMNYAPNVRFCEMTLNGEYMGLYVMMESITAGENARLQLSVQKKQERFSGYLLRLDREGEDPSRIIRPFTSYTYRLIGSMDVIYPGRQNLTEEMRRRIELDFSDFEKALHSYDYDEAEGYRDRIDADSFATYFVLNEFTGNYDAGRYSTYLYKDIDGKYRLCVWDFNSACDNYQERQIPTNGFEMQNGLWYYMLMRDSDFVERVISKYRTLRGGILSEESLNSYIDDTIAYLGDAIERNNARWGYTYLPEEDLLTPAERNPRSYREAVEDMKQFIHERGAWMDENIETLRQYAADSKIKKYNENAS